MIISDERSARRTKTIAKALVSILVAGCTSSTTPATLDGGVRDRGEDSDGNGGDILATETGWPSGLLILDHVTVVDANGKQENRAVLIRWSTIIDVVEAGQSWPADSQVVDSPGRYIVPGLVDPHVHLMYAGTTYPVGDTLEANLRATLYHGVSAIMDVGASLAIFALREAIDQGKLLGPTLRATGPFFTAVGSHPCESTPFNDCQFIDADNAKAHGQALLSKGADGIKAVLADTAATAWPAPRLDVNALSLLTQLAVPVIAHVNSSMDVVEAVAAGVAVLAHPVFEGQLTSQALTAAGQVHGVHTTLGGFANAPDLVDGKLDLQDPQLIVSQGVLQNWQAVRDDPTLLLPGWLQASRQWAINSAASVALMKQAGVKLVPASDAGYLFIPHGLGLHWELQRLAKMGWTPLELLAASTLTAREQMGLDGGLVRPGQVADLLLLIEDPLVSVEALSSIEQVILRGQLIERDALLDRNLRQGAPFGADQVCLTPGDCALGLTCDRLTHLCRPSCTEPYAPINPCGEQAWCMPADGQTATEGVCRPESSCELYRQECGEGLYSMTCHPLDVDTAACRMAGTAQAGDTCVYLGPGSSCASGLYCSPVDARCYWLCDPDGLEQGCPAPTSCVVQLASDGSDWFGLCL